MGKGKRNHKNKKSKPSKPAAAFGAGHHEESVTNPPQPPTPPPIHSDSPMPSTEDKPPAGSVGAGAPIEDRLSETHPLPVEKGIPKVEESGKSESIEGEDTDNNLNEKASAKIENEQVHDAIVEGGRTDNVSSSVEAEPAPRTTGSVDNNSAIEQDNQQKEEEEAPEQREETQKKEEEEVEKEEDQEPPTKTPTTVETTSSAHKKYRSRSGTSVETQELNRNHLNPEDIGPQHIQADRETRELRHIDLEGGEIGYNLGKGDDHDRGSEHHAPAEPVVHNSTEEVQGGLEEFSNEALAEEIVTYAQAAAEEPLTENSAQIADKESAEVSACGKEMGEAVQKALEGQPTETVEEEKGEEKEEKDEGEVTYAQVAASEPPNEETAREKEVSEEAQASLEESSEVAAEEVAPETQELKDVDMKDEIGYNPGRGENHGRESNHHALTESVAEGVAAEGSCSEKPIGEPKIVDEDSFSAIGEEVAKQVHTSVEVPSTTAEEVTAETEELKDIDVKDEIGYNPGKGDDHDHWSQDHAPAERSSTETVVLKASSGVNDLETSAHEQQISNDAKNTTEKTPPGTVEEKASSQTEELKIVDANDEIEHNPGKRDDHDRGSEHRLPTEEPVVKSSVDNADIAVEEPSGEASLEDTELETQEPKGDTHDGVSENQAPAEESSIEAAADKKTSMIQGNLTHDEVAEEMEEAFEELLMEDSAYEQEIPEGDKNGSDRPASEAAGEELAFATSAGVNDSDKVKNDIELVGEQSIDSVAEQDETSTKQSNPSNILEDGLTKETNESGPEHGLPHKDITNDEVSNNAYTEDANDNIKEQSEESAKDAHLPKSTQFGMDTPERQEIGRKDSLENLAPHTPIGIDSLASELGKAYHIPLSNDPSSRGDTNDTPLTYQEDFFSERLSDLTGDREVLEYECSIKIGDSRPKPNLISGTTVTIDQLQETISCFKREVLESLESRNLLVNTGDAQQDQEQQSLTVDISQLGPRLGKMESDLDFIRKQISIIDTSHSNGPSLLPQYSSKSDRASRSTSPNPPVPERRISWSMISLSVVTALGLVALGSMLGSVTREKGLTDKVAQWLFSEGKAVGK